MLTAGLKDIAARVVALHRQDEGKGLALTTAPVMALGIFERVGSNWLSDSLRGEMPQHNEPFRQQLSRKHPMSPSDRVPLDLTDGAWLGELERHHLACALSDLYGHPRHLVKETNLFFSTDTVLTLLPYSPVLVLTRAPVGIASSFARSRLWKRWGYDERYAQVAVTAHSARWRREFEPLLPQDDPEEPIALGRLIAVNALLLARALAGRDRTIVSYEQHVKDPTATLARIAAHLDVALPASPRPRPTTPEAADATFATNGHKNELIATLDRHTAELVSEHANATLIHAAQTLDPQVIATAAEWLAGDDLYELCEPVTRPRPATRPVPVPQKVPLPAYCPVTRVSWRNTLVTNGEMADLLTMLHAAGMPNTQSGTNLLLCPMPHERGGRLRFDPKQRRWLVSPGYEAHPAYWVTWVGAAAMAAWSGARLPTRAEALDAAVGAPPAHNCDYAMGDTSSVIEPGRGAGQVHHLVGNLQIWCSDGPVLSEAEPEQRFLFGAAWNTPGTGEAIGAMRSRYLLGSSRGVGVRLVRDPDTTQATGLGAWELAHRINGWIDDLGNPACSLGELDRRLVTALTGAAASS
ncbi:sulfotransferase [Streptomyces sp. NPDC097727]|uniref:sulfotransferase n=1 Tax=Streptomyces sp. NPDC097727 TaxID=3366092 RepID=UPI0038284BB5